MLNVKSFAPILALIAVGLNAYVVQDPIFGALTLVALLVALGLVLGPRLVPDAALAWQISLGAMVSLAAFSLLGSLIYYSVNVTTTTLMAAVGVMTVVATLVNLKSAPPPSLAVNEGGSHNTSVWSERLIFVLGLLSLVGWWVAVTQVQILEPVRSLWLVLGPFSLIALGVAVLCAFTLLYISKTKELGGLLLMGCIFSALSVAAVVYPLGYGFDPFLHRATVEHIAINGTITPKPLYYIGLYALELMGVKLFSLSGFWVDVLLVPLLAAWGGVTALSLRARQVDLPWLGLACLVFLPFAAFVQTTPQALAFVFTLWAILAPTRPLGLPLIFALAAVITHPLAGIAALAYAVLLILDFRLLPGVSRRVGLGLVTLATALAVPVAFFIQAKISGLSLDFSLGQIFNWSKLPISGFFGSGFNAWGDTAYLFLGNAFIIVVALAILGIVVTPKSQRGWYIPLLVAGAAFVNFVIVSLGFDFTYLISYERTDFALRLLTLTMMFLLPYLAVLGAWVYNKLSERPLGLKLGVLVMLALVFTTNVYAAYPRHDNYARSAGFNLSPSDFDTVRFIDDLAQGEDYIVLSDQALAAAAVESLGFKKYYHTDIFFYPIPTGGPLYQDYLKMVEVRPELSTVQSAKDLAGVDLAFFAVHDYWWQADQIIENTKAIAEDWWTLGDGAVTVFIFRD